MAHLARPLGIMFLAANVVMAALWFVVLHPAANEAVGKAASANIRASSASPVVSYPLASAFFVGNELPPASAGCNFKPTTTAVPSPEGRPVAKLAALPAGFSHLPGATFPPCSVPKFVPTGALLRSMRTAPATEVLSVVQYEGSEGTVLIATLRPNEIARNEGIYLGNPAGGLPDGIPAFTLQGGAESGQPQAGALFRWYQNGIVVDLVGPNLSTDQLRSLASQVVVK